MSPSPSPSLPAGAGGVGAAAGAAAGPLGALTSDQLTTGSISGVVCALAAAGVVVVALRRARASTAAAARARAAADAQKLTRNPLRSVGKAPKPPPVSPPLAAFASYEEAAADRRKAGRRADRAPREGTSR